MDVAELRETLGQAHDLIVRLVSELHDLAGVLEDPASYGFEIDYPLEVRNSLRKYEALVETFNAIPADDHPVTRDQLRGIFREELQKAELEDEDLPPIKLPSIEAAPEVLTAVESYEELIRRGCIADPALEAAVAPWGTHG